VAEYHSNIGKASCYTLPIFYFFNVSASFALPKSLIARSISWLLPYTAVVPGAVFGDDDHLSPSYATSMENIAEGMNRIEEFIKKISV